MNIKEQLKNNIDLKYQKFTSALIPNIDNILGVRANILKKLSKEIIKNNYIDFINSKTEYHEEIMIQGMVIGLIKNDIQTVIKLIKDFIPKINNWAVCDCFCQSLKITKNNKEVVWNFIKPYSKSKKRIRNKILSCNGINLFCRRKIFK